MKRGLKLTEKQEKLFLLHWALIEPTDDQSTKDEEFFQIEVRRLEALAYQLLEEDMQTYQKNKKDSLRNYTREKLARYPLFYREHQKQEVVSYIKIGEVIGTSENRTPLSVGSMEKALLSFFTNLLMMLNAESTKRDADGHATRVAMLDTYMCEEGLSLRAIACLLRAGGPSFESLSRDYGAQGVADLPGAGDSIVTEIRAVLSSKGLNF